MRGALAAEHRQHPALFACHAAQWLTAVLPYQRLLSTQEIMVTYIYIATH
jgi:hypothetical protein